MTIEDKPKTTVTKTSTMNNNFEPSALTKHCHQQSEGKLSESFWSRNLLLQVSALLLFTYSRPKKA